VRSALRSQLLTRIATVAVVLGGVTAGTAVTAPSAFAIPPGCEGTAKLFTNYGVLTSPVEVYAQGYWYWTGCSDTLSYNLTISKYVTGVGWERVASGTDLATYPCTGGTAEYTTNVTPAGDDFDCG
jgi:hypothetical protein